MSSYKTILVADDDPNDIFFLSISLKSIGCPLPIVEAADGRELLDFLTRNRRADLAPACLFLDLKMPLLDGFDVLEWLRNAPEWRDLPVFVLSSSNLTPDQEKALCLGAREFLTKPSGIAELTALMRHSPHINWLGLVPRPD